MLILILHNYLYFILLRDINDVKNLIPFDIVNIYVYTYVLTYIQRNTFLF